MIDQLPEVTESLPAPLASLPEHTDRQIEDAGSPQDAKTAGDFFRRMRLVDNELVNIVYEKYPVNQNVQRDEKSHEVDVDFLDGHPGGNDTNDRVEGNTLRLNRQEYLRYNADYWHEIQSD